MGKLSFCAETPEQLKEYTLIEHCILNTFFLDKRVSPDFTNETKFYNILHHTPKLTRHTIQPHLLLQGTVLARETKR